MPEKFRRSLHCRWSNFSLPFLANGKFELHRHEYLYMALDQHLDWGFLEVPPSIAILAHIYKIGQG